MRFRRKDGFVAECRASHQYLAGITAPDCETRSSPGGMWFYEHGSKIMSRNTEFPQSELVEYLGKDTN